MKRANRQLEKNSMVTNSDEIWNCFLKKLQFSNSDEKNTLIELFEFEEKYVIGAFFDN